MMATPELGGSKRGALWHTTSLVTFTAAVNL